MMAVLIYGLTLFLSPDGTGSGHAILDIRFLVLLLHGRLFDSDDLLVPVVILGIGMVLKLLVHLLYLQWQASLCKTAKRSVLPTESISLPRHR